MRRLRALRAAIRAYRRMMRWRMTWGRVWAMRFVTSYTPKWLLRTTAPRSGRGRMEGK